jgi:hypothetical protein
MAGGGTATLGVPFRNIWRKLRHPAVRTFVRIYTATWSNYAEPSQMHKHTPSTGPNVADAG